MENIYPESLQIPPMKIWQLPKQKRMYPEVYVGGKIKDYYATVKKDGFWYQAEIWKENSYLFSRTRSSSVLMKGNFVDKSDNVPGIMADLINIFPIGTIIIGEVVVKNGISSSSKVSKIMGSGTKKSVERQFNCPVCYYIHDIIYHDKENLQSLPAEYRFGMLEKYREVIENSTNLQLAEKFEFDDWDSFAVWLSKVYERGEEGVVLKKKKAPYMAGKSPAWSSIKFKTNNTFDVVCLGYDPPTKLYSGSNITSWEYWENGQPVTKAYANDWYGAIKIGVYKGEDIIHMGTVAGLTEELLQDLKEHGEDYIGMPMEIKAMSISERGNAFRHPTFIRFRDDIGAKEDCTYEKVFGGDDADADTDTDA